jgi:hypothetical protein
LYECGALKLVEVILEGEWRMKENNEGDKPD